MSSTPDVTVIIPVYNKAQYLRDCLDSVLHQSLSTIEVICVDDASTDNSLSILREYVRSDRRVRLICHDANRGVSAARNTGIGAASGQYMQFTDADDLLPREGLEVLQGRIRSDDVEIVRGMVATFTGDTPDQLAIANPVTDRIRVRPMEVEDFWIPWWHQCYLFLTSFVVREGIVFPELIAGEDPVFIASALVRAGQMSSIAHVTYWYRHQPFLRKQRVSFAHFESYVKHAALVKEIFLAHKVESWTRGYGPFVVGDIRAYLSLCEASEEQRQNASASIDRLLEGFD